MKRHIGAAGTSALALGLGLGATAADAGITHVNIGLDLPLGTSSLSNALWGMQLDFDLANVRIGGGGYAPPEYSGSLAVTGDSGTKVVTSYGSMANALIADTLIPGSLTFATGSSLTMYDDGAGAGEWSPPTTAFLGLEAGGKFGWMRVSVSESSTGFLGATVVDYAWEDCAGEKIKAGQVSGDVACDEPTPAPLPGTLALLAAGALPLLAARRRRPALER